MIILEENFKWHLEAFASELFIYRHWTARNGRCCNTTAVPSSCKTESIGELVQCLYILVRI